MGPGEGGVGLLLLVAGSPSAGSEEEATRGDGQLQGTVAVGRRVAAMLASVVRE